MITGTAYGTILNDTAQLASAAGLFAAAPYTAPPRAPVLYIKPRPCFRFAGASIPLPAGMDEVEVAPTVGLLFARNLAAGTAADALDAVGGVCLALDVSKPSDLYAPGFTPVSIQ